MKMIGITGGTGCGKGVVAGVFSSCGYPIYDCDRAYHMMTSFRSPCVEELTQVFGEEIVFDNGALNRAVLREMVFSSEANAKARLARLNEITHRYVKRDLFVWCEEMKRQGHTVVVIDAPALFEAELEKDCSAVIGVVASDEVRIQRIMARDGITLQAAQMRVKAQHTSEFYRKHCDYIVENDSSMDMVCVQTNEIINDMIKRGILQ